MIYDYFPDFQVVFTGSSILDIYKGNADLSRRALSYFLPGLSFREYIMLSKGIQILPYSLQDILNHKVELPGVNHPLPLFKEYLENSYYPFLVIPDMTNAYVISLI